jgi:hypothetical protein
MTLAGFRGEVPAEALQRPKALLRIHVGHAVGAADRLQSLPDLGERRAEIAQDAAGVVLLSGQPQQEVLGRHEVVTELSRRVHRVVERLAKVARQIRVGPTLDPGHRVERFERAGSHEGHGHFELLENGNDDALLLGEQRVQEVDAVDLCIASPARVRSRALEGFRRFDGEFVRGKHHLVRVRVLRAPTPAIPAASVPSAPLKGQDPGQLLSRQASPRRS